MYKETIASLISKEEFAFDKGFIEYIVKQLSQGLSDKLITILDKEDEVIVRQSNVMVSEYMPTNFMEYRRQIEWCPLVRCKDCKHKQGSACDYSAVWVQPDGYCKWGERREDA